MRIEVMLTFYIWLGDWTVTENLHCRGSVHATNPAHRNTENPRLWLCFSGVWRRQVKLCYICCMPCWQHKADTDQAGLVHSPLCRLLTKRVATLTDCDSRLEYLQKSFNLTAHSVSRQRAASGVYEWQEIHRKYTDKQGRLTWCWRHPRKRFW